jgi:hypothetical protein
MPPRTEPSACSTFRSKHWRRSAVAIMHPQTNYGHLVATVEIFTGMCFVAVMTGLVFARFLRPRARFVFATQVVIAGHEGP